MNYARTSASCTLIDYQEYQHIYIFGGLGEPDFETALTSIERYDVSNNVWMNVSNVQ